MTLWSTPCTDAPAKACALVAGLFLLACCLVSLVVATGELSEEELLRAAGEGVYVTDVAAAVAQHQAVEGVDIPTPPNVVATYPIGTVKAAPNPALATAFEDYVLGPTGQADLASFGFLPPT